MTPGQMTPGKMTPGKMTASKMTAERAQADEVRAGRVLAVTGWPARCRGCGPEQVSSMARPSRRPGTCRSLMRPGTRSWRGKGSGCATRDRCSSVRARRLGWSRQT